VVLTFALLESSSLFRLSTFNDERCLRLAGLSWQRHSGLRLVPDVGYLTGKILWSQKLLASFLDQQATSSLDLTQGFSDVGAVDIHPRNVVYSSKLGSAMFPHLSFSFLFLMFVLLV
jgi:hypothetical protein